MLMTRRNILMAAMGCCIPLVARLAHGQESSAAERARTLNKQEVLDLVANRKLTYLTARATGMASATEGILQLVFVKTEDSGGTLNAYTGKSSSSGKWHVEDNGRLIRQYESERWGTKPFGVTIVQKNDKYFVRFGTSEDHEIIKIE